VDLYDQRRIAQLGDKFFHHQHGLPSIDSDDRNPVLSVELQGEPLLAPFFLAASVAKDRSSNCNVNAQAVIQ
jgi:hypothetical protein